jgi:hypothetical protein
VVRQNEGFPFTFLKSIVQRTKPYVQIRKKLDEQEIRSGGCSKGILLPRMVVKIY